MAIFYDKIKGLTPGSKHVNIKLNDDKAPNIILEPDDEQNKKDLGTLIVSNPDKLQYIEGDLVLSGLGMYKASDDEYVTESGISINESKVSIQSPSVAISSNTTNTNAVEVTGNVQLNNELFANGKITTPTIKVEKTLYKDANNEYIGNYGDESTPVYWAGGQPKACNIGLNMGYFTYDGTKAGSENQQVKAYYTTGNRMTGFTKSFDTVDKWTPTTNWSYSGVTAQITKDSQLVTGSGCIRQSIDRDDGFKFMFPATWEIINAMALPYGKSLETGSELAYKMYYDKNSVYLAVLGGAESDYKMSFTFTAYKYDHIVNLVFQNANEKEDVYYTTGNGWDHGDGQSTIIATAGSIRLSYNQFDLEATGMTYNLETLKEEIIKDTKGNEESAIPINIFKFDPDSGLNKHIQSSHFYILSPWRKAVHGAASDGGDVNADNWSQMIDKLYLMVYTEDASGVRTKTYSKVDSAATYDKDETYYLSCKYIEWAPNKYHGHYDNEGFKSMAAAGKLYTYDGTSDTYTAVAESANYSASTKYYTERMEEIASNTDWFTAPRKYGIIPQVDCVEFITTPMTVYPAGDSYKMHLEGFKKVVDKDLDFYEFNGKWYWVWAAGRTTNQWFITFKFKVFLNTDHKTSKQYNARIQFGDAGQCYNYYKDPGKNKGHAFNISGFGDGAKYAIEISGTRDWD